MNEKRIGKIGTVEIRLAPPSIEQPRYERRYVPVTPASREIVGSDAKVAEESTVAEWHMDDWSAGEGDIRWSNRGRYNKSDGAGPVSDGTGITTNAYVEQMDDTGGGTVMTDARVIARAAGRLVTADDMGGSLFKFNDSTSEWDSLWAIGGSGTDDILAIAAVDSTSIFVTQWGGDLRKVQSGSNSLHYSGFGCRMVGFQGQLYGLLNNSLYDIDTGTATTRTEVMNVGGQLDRTTGIIERISTSDVGPIWLAPLDDGSTYIYEYNAADDTGYIVGEIPKDVQPYDIFFHAGIYFVTFRYAGDDSLSGDAWLYYQLGGQRGVAGPIRSVTGTTASKGAAIAGVVGDRLYIVYDTSLWAYDLSSGGISMAARDLPEATSARAYGSDIHVASGTTAFRVDLDLYDQDSGAELTTGRHDFGYLGLYKILTRITVTCESALAAFESVGVAYSVDGGSFTTLGSSLTTGETAKTWAVSSSSTTARGVEFEIKVLPTAAGGSSSPKIVGVTAEAIGSESRLEWVMQIDVSDNNEQHGQTIVDGLKALKTAHNVVEFSDPWNVLDHTAAETFDVTVEECNIPTENAGGDPMAVVRLRAVETV
ncbi:hypothetical protein ACFL0N_01745 [Pseudomonadota bacterium]